MLRGYNATQLLTGALIGGRVSPALSQKRAFRESRCCLAKPPAPNSDPTEELKRKLAQLKRNAEMNMRNSPTAQQMKSTVNGVWRTVDLKLAEYGFTNGGVTDSDANMIRYLISAMIVLYLVFFISPLSVRQWFMENILLTSRNGGRIYPLFTSLFVHTEVLSLLFSCLIIYSVAPMLMRSVGRAHFWRVLFGAGVASNAFFSMKEANVFSGWAPSMSFQAGMSSGCSALIAMSCLLTPHQTVQFFFFPVTAIYIAYGILAYDMITFILALGGGRPNHCGGGLFAGAYWYAVLGQKTL